MYGLGLWCVYVFLIQFLRFYVALIRHRRVPRWAFYDVRTCWSHSAWSFVRDQIIGDKSHTELQLSQWLDCDVWMVCWNILEVSEKRLDRWGGCEDVKMEFEGMVSREVSRGDNTCTLTLGDGLVVGGGWLFDFGGIFGLGLCLWFMLFLFLFLFAIWYGPCGLGISGGLFRWGEDVYRAWH